jgi:hypothetical protein
VFEQLVAPLFKPLPRKHASTVARQQALRASRAGILQAILRRHLLEQRKSFGKELFMAPILVSAVMVAQIRSEPV